MNKFLRLFTLGVLSLPAALCAQQIRIQGAEQELIAGPGIRHSGSNGWTPCNSGAYTKKTNCNITVTNIPGRNLAGSALLLCMRR